MTTYVYFRNDDVNTLDKELPAVTQIFLDNNIPIIHAVEPANLRSNTASWLIRTKSDNPNLIEIMQHGFDHQIRYHGEFGGKRKFDDQLQCISRGRQIMQETFGHHFLNAINFPFGHYNKHTIRAVNDTGYAIISSHFKPSISKRIFYFLGRSLKKGQIFGKHVAHHMQYYPRTNLFEIDISISFISKYVGSYPSKQCHFLTPEEILKEFKSIKKYTNFIGFLLHHRYHNTQHSLDIITKTIDKLAAQDVCFTNYTQLYAEFS